MKTSLIKFIFPCLLFISTVNLAQSLNVGLRFEPCFYSQKEIPENKTQLKFIPYPYSFYIKGAIIFSEKYELELKTGMMFSEELFGLDYIVLFKYGITKTLFPFITYMLHENSGASHQGWGIYNRNMVFIGFGAEAKITEIFSLDLVYYAPVGKTDLKYEFNYFTNSGAATYSPITISQMGPMVKLGFIFNVFRF